MPCYSKNGWRRSLLEIYTRKWMVRKLQILHVTILFPFHNLNDRHNRKNIKHHLSISVLRSRWQFLQETRATCAKVGRPQYFCVKSLLAPEGNPKIWPSIKKSFGWSHVSAFPFSPSIIALDVPGFWAKWCTKIALLSESSFVDYHFDYYYSLKCTSKINSLS